MKKTLYTAALALSVVLPVQAQELSGSLTVEGAYNPVIRNHDRLSGLPSRFQGELPQSSLPASLAGLHRSCPVLHSFSLPIPT